MKILIKTLEKIKTVRTRDNNKNIGEVRMEYFDEDNRNIATKKEEELLIKPKKEKGGLFACC